METFWESTRQPVSGRTLPAWVLTRCAPTRVRTCALSARGPSAQKAVQRMQTVWVSGFYVFEMFCRSNQVSRTISRSVSYSLPQVTTRCALCRTTTTASTATTTTAPMVAHQTPTVLSPTLCVGRFSLTDADVVRIRTARLFKHP